MPFKFIVSTSLVVLFILPGAFASHGGGDAARRDTQPPKPLSRKESDDLREKALSKVLKSDQLKELGGYLDAILKSLGKKRVEELKNVVRLTRDARVGFMETFDMEEAEGLKKRLDINTKRLGKEVETAVKDVLGFTIQSSREVVMKYNGLSATVEVELQAIDKNGNRFFIKIDPSRGIDMRQVAVFDDKDRTPKLDLSLPTAPKETQVGLSLEARLYYGGDQSITLHQKRSFLGVEYPASGPLYRFIDALLEKRVPGFNKESDRYTPEVITEIQVRPTQAFK